MLNGFKYSKLLNNSIWPIDGTLTDTTTSSQSKPGASGKKGYSTFSKTLGLERDQMV